MIDYCPAAHHDPLRGIDFKYLRSEKRRAHHEACCDEAFHDPRKTTLHLLFHENNQEDTYELLRYELCP